MCARTSENDDGDAHDALPFHKLAGRRRRSFFIPSLFAERRRSFYYRGASGHKLSTRRRSYFVSCRAREVANHSARLMCARLRSFVPPVFTAAAKSDQTHKSFAPDVLLGGVPTV